MLFSAVITFLIGFEPFHELTNFPDDCAVYLEADINRELDTALEHYYSI